MGGSVDPSTARARFQPVFPEIASPDLRVMGYDGLWLMDYDGFEQVGPLYGACRVVPCRAVPCRAVPWRDVPCRAVP